MSITVGPLNMNAKQIENTFIKTAKDKIKLK